jgi:hypothetical protein
MERRGGSRFEDEDDDEYERCPYWLLAIRAALGLRGKRLGVRFFHEDRTDGGCGDWVSGERSK